MKNVINWTCKYVIIEEDVKKFRLRYEHSKVVIALFILRCFVLLYSIVEIYCSNAIFLFKCYILRLTVLSVNH